MISFVETKLFTRLAQEYLNDDEYSQLQQALVADPEAGSIIPGSVLVQRSDEPINLPGCRRASASHAGL